jgi:hypothetical protein
MHHFRSQKSTNPALTSDRKMKSNTTDIFFVSTPQVAAVIRPNKSMPDTGAQDGDDDDLRKVKRTASGGLFFRRKRSAEEQEAISKVRARELAAFYELSDHKETSLKKQANTAKSATTIPKISNVLSAKQAVFVYAEKQKASSRLSSKQTSIEGDSERRIELPDESVTRNIFRSKHSETTKTPGSSKTCQKKAVATISLGKKRYSSSSTEKLVENVSIKNAWFSKLSLSEEVAEDIEIDPTLSPSSSRYSVAETEAETPSPRALKAANGQVYEKVFNFC